MSLVRTILVGGALAIFLALGTLMRPGGVELRVTPLDGGDPSS